MGFIERNKAALNDRVARSVVGKYFHLDGSGHVGQHHAILLLQSAQLTKEAQRDSKCEVYYRATSRSDDVLYHGLHYCCQCKILVGCKNLPGADESI
jgi:hypothetical protein